MTWACILEEDYKAKKRAKGLDPWKEWIKEHDKAGEKK